MMEILESAVEEAILPHDAEVIGKEVEAIVRLINQNPFSERIWELLLNPEVAVRKVKNKRDRLSEPNCIGTAFYVAGVSDLGYPYHAYDYELDEHMRDPGSEEEDSPLFRRFDKGRIPGAFCFSYCVSGDDWHAGIYLGALNDRHVLFAQNGRGCKFCVQTLARNYASPNFYVPRTLLERKG
jgi:hypothetical protein